MKLLSLWIVILLLNPPSLLLAQEDAGELEELEQELNSLESESGQEVSEGPDFSETENPEDLGTLENNDLEQELEDVLGGEDGQENVVDTPSSPSLEEEIDSIEEQQNVAAPKEPVEIPSDDLLDTPAPEEIAEPNEPIEIPGASDEVPENIAAPQEEMPTEPMAQQTPEMLTPLPDEPNYRKERDIFNAYQYIKNYSNTEESWPQASQGREAESYTVQNGDNLWDISLTLFGNPYFWPKIWQINSSITNPHQIRPGDALMFVEGNLQQAPQLTQGQESSEGAEEEVATESEISEEELLADLPDLPEQSSQLPPLIDLPPSLKQWHSTKKGADDFSADRITKMAWQVPNMVRLSSYIVEDLPTSLGKINEIEIGFDTANLYQYVFIESDQIGVGDTLVAYKVKDELKKSFTERLGYTIEMQGTLKVTEAVTTGKKNVFKAMVTYIANPIMKGSLVRKGGYPFKTIHKEAPVTPLQIEIIGGEFDPDRKVLATGSIVYFGNGSDAGVQDGNILQIIKNQKMRNKRSLVENNTQVIGKVQIIDVQPTRSTGLVISSSENIMVGDNSGSSTVLSLDATSPNDSVDEVDEIDQELELLDE